jgi:bacillithiol biosynthesis cysteine-adding enzyme BshC
MIQPILSLPLEETNLVPPIVKDYLKQHSNLEKYVSSWHNLEGLEEAMAHRNFSGEKREILVNGLNQQYVAANISLEANSATQVNIASLLSPNTFTITTGHQLSLFGGTLFMGYKILTAINLALVCKAKYPEKNFVPILWLASEDHDFEEIKGTYLFGKQLDWNIASHGAPTGQIPIQEMESVLEEIAILLGNHPMAENWVQKIKTAYLGKENLAQATLHFYHELFQEFGLVVLDANQIALKKILQPVMRADILEQKSYEAQHASDAFLAAHYKLQIHARPINFFYISPGGSRDLIKPNGDGFKAGESGRTFTHQEMEEEISIYPERFSPNVNLRPVYQEMILPNLAYIGGPAEVGYWLQLKSVFDVYQTPFPLVGVRFMNLMLGGGLKEKVEKFGLQLGDLLLSESDLVAKYLLSSQALDFHAQTQVILDQVQVLVDQIKNLDAPLGKEFLETKLGLKDFFKGKSGAVKRALEQHEAAQIEKLIKLRNRIYPKGVLQERIETLMQYEVMMKEPILNELLAQVNPLSGQLNISAY